MRPKIRVYREGMKLNSLSDSSLLEQTKTLVAEERNLTTQVLWHFAEIQKRRLYAQQGYGSLFEYAVKVLGYSEAAAGRRIAAMRLLVQVPEVEESVKSGALNLSTLSSVHHFLKEKESPTSHAEKLELLQSLEGKSRRECEKQLASLCPAAPPAERERVISPELTEIRFVADEALMEKLQKIRELDAHVQADPSYLELFHRMADLALKKLDPEQKKPRTAVAATPPAELENATTLDSPRQSDSRIIAVAVKRAVRERDQECALT